MKITLHAVDCRDANDQSGKNWSCVYEGLGEEGYHRVMAMMKAFPQALIENYKGTSGCRNKEVHFEYFAEEKEIDFQWRMTKKEFLRLMYPHDTSNNYCGSVHFGDCKLEFVFDHCEHNKFISFNNLYVYGKDDGYANLEDGTPYSYEDDMFALPKDDDFDKWKAECEKLIIKSLNNDKNYLLRYAIQKTKVDEWYPQCKWYMTVMDASYMMATKMLKDRSAAFAFCVVSAEEAKGNPADHDEMTGGWHGVKRIDGFFDNEPEEFIVAVGHYGGGGVAFAYADCECGECADRATCTQELAKAIGNATGEGVNCWLYVEEDTKKEDK